MTATTEAQGCRALRAVLDHVALGREIPDSDELRDVLVWLEYLLPAVFAEEYPWWRYEHIDGILPGVARKAGPWEAEVIGLCILMSDQAHVPIAVRLRIGSTADAIKLLDCGLGEVGDEHGGLQRTYQMRSSKLLARVVHRAAAIRWAYTAGIGSQASHRR